MRALLIFCRFNPYFCFFAGLRGQIRNTLSSRRNAAPLFSGFGILHARVQLRGTFSRVFGLVHAEPAESGYRRIKPAAKSRRRALTPWSQPVKSRDSGRPHESRVDRPVILPEEPGPERERLDKKAVSCTQFTSRTHPGRREDATRRRANPRQARRCQCCHFCPSRGIVPLIGAAKIAVASSGSSCMSASYLARVARPLGRPVVAATTARGPNAAGRCRFSTSVLRRALAGNSRGPRIASTWPMSGIFAIAAAAGLVGWGASELRHGNFPGTMLLDSGFLPRYASMRQMEQVCRTTASGAPCSGGICY